MFYRQCSYRARQTDNREPAHGIHVRLWSLVLLNWPVLSSAQTLAVGKNAVYSRIPPNWESYLGIFAALFLLLCVTGLVQRIRQRTAELAATIQAIPDLLFEVDLEGRYHYCHAYAACLDNLIAPASELLGRTFSEVMPSEAATICLCALHEANLHGHSTGHQIELPIGEGKRWFELSVVRKGPHSGQNTRFILLSRDITERRTVEGRLKHKGEQLLALSHAASHINSHLETPVVLRELVASAMQVTGAEEGTAGLREDNGTIVFREYNFRGIWQSSAISYSPGTGIPGRVIDTLEPYLTNDPDDPLLARKNRRKPAKPSIRSVLATPIIDRNGHAIGCFSLINKPGGFDNHDGVLLKSIAMSAAVALQNSAVLAEHKRIEDDLRQSELLKDTVLTSAAYAIVATDKQGVITIFNPVAEALTGYSATEVIGRERPDIFFATKEASPFAEEHRQTSENAAFTPFGTLAGKTRRTGKPSVHEWDIVRKDGRIVPVELSITAMRDSWDNLRGYMGIACDISERREENARKSLSAKVFEEGHEGIIITNAQREIVSVNPAFSRITGYCADESIGKGMQMLASERNDQAFYDDLWSALETDGRWQGELWNRRKDGSIYPQRTSICRAADAEGATTHYITTFSDISDYKDAEAAIRKLAYYDLLTGLPNRALLADRMDYLLSRARRNQESLCLMFLDLDRFKNINDALGHHIGDELLIQLAKRLRSALREEDIVSRLGGDEFILLFPETSTDGAIRLADKLLRIIEPRYLVGPHELSCTASIGIALYPNDGDSLETLSMSADTAMYRAKKAGRNTYRFFMNDMQTTSARALRIENELRRALDKKELSLNYQPQLSLLTNRIIGAEALVRWRHPELGAISPAEFIPIAEESGLILPIGDWVLRTAARQMHAWIEGGLPPMTISVNLSALQFRHPDLIEHVSRILEEEHLRASSLELELTESATMDDPLTAITVIRKLRERGIQMAIDDFGTGYSSMTHLKRFSANRLKIDQSFVRNVLNDPEDEAIITAIISLARNLGMRTIAEGVEEPGQLDFLRRHGCDEIQGYLFGRPMPDEAFEHFVRTHLEQSANG